MSPAAPRQSESWQTQILRHFSAEIASTCQVTVTADPDGLILDDQVSTELDALGFDVVPYRDAIEFRFYYETLHRLKWDSGQHSSVVVSVPAPGEGLGTVPNDILAAAERHGRVLEISLARLFPSLASDVLDVIDRSDLDAIWSATSIGGNDSLGRTQTQDLVLRAVFKLATEMIATEEDLLSQLLRLHQRDRIVPVTLAARFAQSLAAQATFAAWPLEELVLSRDSFYEFLQERWPRFLKTWDGDIECPPLRSPVPASIDFSAPEVATVIDNLFLDGRLQPITVPNPERFTNRWEQVGIRGVTRSGTYEQCRDLLKTVVSNLPEPHVPPTVWSAFAHRWAETVTLIDTLDASERSKLIPALDTARQQADVRLFEWLQERFGAVANRGFLPMPAMVHRIPEFLAHKRKPGDKIALVIIDGMSISQWLTIKDAAGTEWKRDLRLEEAVVFAWIPTVTAISRQSIFSGQLPLFLESTIDSTAAEERHWKSFWEDRGWRRDRAAVIKHRLEEPEPALISRVAEMIDTGRIECLGVAVNSLDRLVHGAGPEENVFNASVQQWARNGHVAALVRTLLDRDFSVAIASDHGNVQACGIGRPNVGSIPDDRGQRAIIFPDENTLFDVHRDMPDTVPWPGIGLPESMHVLLAKDRGAFVSQSGSIRTHGGASIEEVLVPFIKVSPSA